MSSAHPPPFHMPSRSAHQTHPSAAEAPAGGVPALSSHSSPPHITALPPRLYLLCEDGALLGMIKVGRLVTRPARIRGLRHSERATATSRSTRSGPSTSTTGYVSARPSPYNWSVRRSPYEPAARQNNSVVRAPQKAHRRRRRRRARHECPRLLRRAGAARDRAP